MGQLLTLLQSKLFRYIALIAAFALLELYIYNAGKDAVQSQWDLANTKTQQRIKDLEAEAARITTRVETVYVDRVKEIKTKGDTIVKYIPQYITTEDDNRCTINNGFVRLHDAAANNTVPNPTSSTDAAASTVNLSTVATTVTTNYTTCNAIREQVIGLQTWIQEQQLIDRDK